jgi:glycerol-3-phosphate dehydrogenase subunit C
MKSQGIGRPWLQLLRAVPGIEIEEIKADCCGMAGTYGFKKEKYKISMDIGRDLFRGVLAYKPDLAVTECGSCQMQIEHGTHVRTLHPAEILYEAYQTSRGATGRSTS